jgi:hypothetical protein
MITCQHCDKAVRTNSVIGSQSEEFRPLTKTSIDLAFRRTSLVLVEDFHSFVVTMIVEVVRLLPRTWYTSVAAAQARNICILRRRKKGKILKIFMGIDKIRS